VLEKVTDMAWLARMTVGMVASTFWPDDIWYAVLGTAMLECSQAPVTVASRPVSAASASGETPAKDTARL